MLSAPLQQQHDSGSKARYQVDSIAINEAEREKKCHRVQGTETIIKITKYTQYTRKMVPITGKASSFFVFLEFSKTK